MLIRPCSVIPDSFRDLGLFRDLFEKAVISTQPPLDVSMIPDIAGGDSGTTDGDITVGDFGTTPSLSSRTCSGISGTTGEGPIP